MSVYEFPVAITVGSVPSSATTGDWTGTLDGTEGAAFLARSNHTGTQTAATISDFATATKAVTGIDAANIGAGAISNAEYGYLDGVTSAIQTQISGKQDSGNYVTALTGDGTATGPGSVALTLATVNSNTGSFGTAAAVPTLTVNAKGLITAVSNTTIQITESQVTSLVSDLAAKQASGNYITALTGDMTASGSGSAVGTLATVNSNVGSFGTASNVSAITVNAKGLVTAAANTPISISAATALTGILPAANGGRDTQPLMNYGGMNFNGTTTYLDTNALTGIADGKVGTIFLIARFANAASGTEYIIDNTGEQFAVYRASNGAVHVIAENSSGTGILHLTGTAGAASAAGTYLVLASWDLTTAGTGRLYVNDVSGVTETTYTNDTIDYTVAEWSFGARPSGVTFFTGDIYLAWLDPTAWMELNTASNRRKFYDVNLVPVFLGTNGSLPTGTQPGGFWGYGNSGTWDMNRGSFVSTSFTRNGAIADATTALYGQYMPFATFVSTPPRVVTAAGAITVGASDYVVIVNKTSGAATVVNLPASPVTGRTLIVKDGKGDANTNNITLTPAAGNIDSAGTYVMNVAYQSATVIYNGASWSLI